MSSIASSSSGSGNDYSNIYSSTLGSGNSISGGISFDGIGSGTDFQSMIDQLKKVEEIPKNRLGAWRDDWQRRVNGFQTLIDTFQAASKKLSSFDSLGTFLTKVVSSSDPNAVSAKSEADTPLGSYKINVAQLASNGMLTTKNLAGANKNDIIAPSACTFSYKYGTETRTLSIPTGTTLESFVNIINNDSRNPGVKASLIKSGAGYIFQVQGKETGEEHKLEIVSSNIPTMAGAADWYVREAEDALFYLEGREAQILRSSSNSLTEVVPGLTISLTNTTDTVERNPDGTVKWTSDIPPKLTIQDSNPVMLTVTNDAGSAKEKVKEFVETVNEVIKAFQDLTKYDNGKKTTDGLSSGSQFTGQKGSVLTGNYGVQLLSSKTKSMLAERGNGFSPLQKDGTGDVFHALTKIGISVDTDQSSATFGQLLIAEGESEENSPFMTLDEALDHDPEAVARLLASDKVVRSQSSDFSFAGMLQKDMVKGGEHSLEYTVSGGSVTQVLIDGKPAVYDASSQEWTSIAEGSKGMSFRIDNLANGTHSGTFSVQQGKINEMNEFFKNELKGEGLKVGTQTDEKGSLIVLKENYLNIIDNIEKKIEKEESRLILWEIRMRAQFSRLDTLLASYSDQMSAASAALGSASSNYGGK
jgi:Flagellar capping protein